MDDELISNMEESFQDTLSKSNDFIGATQNAIIDAAENVTGIFETADKTPKEQIHLEPFYMEVEFWVGIAFILTVIFLAKPLFLYVKSALRARIERTAQSITDAMKLRDDAQILLSEYQRRYLNASSEMQKIEQSTKEILENIKNEETAKIESGFKIKEQETEQRMKASAIRLENEINASASQLAVKLAQKAIQNYVKETDKSQMIDHAIAELDKFIA